MTDRPGLYELMGTYVIDGWPDEPGSIWAILDEFIEGDDRAELVPAEVAEIRHLPEDQLADLIQGLGASYNPAFDGMTYRAWLEEVARRITVAMGEGSPE